MPETIQREKIVLFDGVCNLCSGMVAFILRHERSPIFSFASIQSQAGKDLLSRCGLPPDYAGSVLFIDTGIVYARSSAVLRIGQALRFPWPILSYAALLVPKVVRDRMYDQIATHRYAWFGKRDVCPAPAEELRSRFYEVRR